MGAEARCRARVAGKTVSGNARLETSALEFRGPGVRLSIPFAEMSAVSAHGGVLGVEAAGGRFSFTIGAAAERWAKRILHPPSRLAKIGVKPEWRASALGPIDDGFLQELENSVAELSIGRVAKQRDAIFLGAAHERDLARLAQLVSCLKPNGALWVIRPKGRPEISERAVMAAGKAAGLVDVKVVSFSATHTAEKFVIPVAARRP